MVAVAYRPLIFFACMCRLLTCLRRREGGGALVYIASNLQHVQSVYLLLVLFYLRGFSWVLLLAADLGPSAALVGLQSVLNPCLTFNCTITACKQHQLKLATAQAARVKTTKQLRLAPVNSVQVRQHQAIQGGAVWVPAND